MGKIYSLYYINYCIERDVTKDELINTMNKMNLRWEYNEKTKDFEIFEPCFWVYRERSFFE